jgi:phosphatidylinositol-3-phosphatase
MKKIVFLTILCLVLVSCAPASSLGKSIVPPASNVRVASTRLLAASLQPTKSPTQPAATATETATPTVSLVGPIPNFDHIVLILLENEYYQDAIGNAQMPHLNALAQQNVLLSNYSAVGHPSLPNYLALVSGSTQNVSDDCIDCFLDQPNLADELEASGRSWKAYMESMPSPCFLGDSRPYAQFTNPFLYFNSIRSDTTRCNRSIVPLTSLDADLAANQLPNFSWIMPNLCNSGHSCDQATADNWMNGMVAKLQASPALGQNSLIIVTFDEGVLHGATAKNRGQVPAVLISPMARQGFNDPSSYSHYSLLKTILMAWNLPALGQTAQKTVQPIVAPWTNPPGE